tara:strand:- start:16502 stop:17788 length:1287 start_codon:yes stop_codon:yes gene_type:complete
MATNTARPGDQYRPRPSQRDPMAVQQMLTAQLMGDSQIQQMQLLYKRLNAYYDNPRGYNNEQLEDLVKAGARHGIEVDLAAQDKATAMENVGAAMVGSMDSLLFDLIPDDWYSSRRTATARAIGNWAGILIPVAIATVGTGGMAAPVLAAIGKTAMRGGKKAAMKMGAKEGGKALRAMEENGARIVRSALKWTPGGIIGQQMPRAAMGAGQLMSKFGPTAKWGDKLVDSQLAQRGLKEGAEGIIKKAQRFAKKGDTEGMLGVLDDVGQEYAPHLPGAVERLAKSGKIKGVTKDVLEEATQKFGKATIGADDLDDIAKGFLGYKKGGGPARKTAQSVMDNLKTGLKEGKSIDEIADAAAIPKRSKQALKKIWSDPNERANLLQKLAEGGVEAETSIMGALGSVAVPAGIAGLEAGFMGSSEVMDELGGF